MAPKRSTNRELALKLWVKSKGTMTPKQIGDQLGVSNVLIRKWKFLDNWENVPLKRPRGGQIGNKNSVGNAGGPGGPYGNDHALKHGLYRKFLPDDPEFQELMEFVQQMDPLDMLWQAVEIAFAKMMWAQRIMFVKDKSDLTKELKREKESTGDKSDSWEREYEVQFAWDKQSVDIKTYSVASREFRSAMKQFLSAAPENDERRLKLELMQAQIEKAKAEAKALDDPDGKSGVQIVDDVQRSKST